MIKMNETEKINIKLYLGDALKILPTIEAKVDTIVTDPPYFVLQKTQEWDNFGNLQEFINFTKTWMEMIYDIAKENASLYVFWSQKYMKEMFNMETRWELKRMLIWHHPNLAKTTKKMYLWTYDPIFYFIKGEPHFDANFSSQENVDVFVYSKPQSNWNKNKGYHPASKPVKLLENLIKVSTVKGDTVLDPFMGAGSTAIACVNLGRNFIGIEKDEKYFHIAEELINKYRTQSKLWEGDKNE
jgi:site-specific DNA-methyltransferase (adenine-specific)